MTRLFFDPSWIDQVLQGLKTLLALWIDLFQTDKKFLAAYSFLLLLDAFTGTFWNEGEAQPRKLRALGRTLGEALRAVVVLAAVTPLGNAIGVFGWMIEAAYAWFLARSVRSVVQNVTTTESDVRRFIRYLLEEAKRRNNMYLGEDEDPDSQSREVSYEGARQRRQGGETETGASDTQG